MRSTKRRLIVLAFLSSIIFGISAAGATVENQNGEKFDPGSYAFPIMQFDPSQEKVIVNGELSPVIQAAAADGAPEGFTSKSIRMPLIPAGSIIYHSNDGVTTVFDQDGKQILSAYDSQAEMIQTPMGLIPATHVHFSPSGSYSYISDNATFIVLNNTVLYITIHEAPYPVEKSEEDIVSRGLSLLSAEGLDAESTEDEFIGAPVMASAVVDDPAFNPGDNFIVDWTVPESPHQTGSFSPTYVSMGENQIGSSSGSPAYHTIKAITEYDHYSDTWTMTVCSYDRYGSLGWDSHCLNKFPIETGDTMEGRIEYTETGTPADPHHSIRVYIIDMETGFGISSGFQYTAYQYSVTQQNLLLQGDLTNLDDNTIIGKVVFNPTGFTSLPTFFADSSNPQLPHLNVEKLWPDGIVFHTRAEPVEKTFSITNSMFENGEATEASKSVIKTVEDRLYSAGWGEPVYTGAGTSVDRNFFGGDTSWTGNNINDATLHYHAGHGSFLGDATPGNTSLVISKFDENSGSFNGDWFNAQDVQKKWGGNNKWVVLHSCNILKDTKWRDAMGTTHAIFGFATVTDMDKEVPNLFFSNALEGKTLFDSWKDATKIALKNTPAATHFDENNELDFTHDTIPVVAAVYFKTSKQKSMDHLPGEGDIAPDGGTEDVPVLYAWNCHTGDMVLL